MRTTACAVTILLTVALVGCGGGSSPSAPQPSPTSPITKGILLINQTSTGLYGITSEGLYRLKLPIEVKAMNDIPLTLNHARMTLFDRNGAELFHVDDTADDILKQAGSLVVTRDRTLTFTIVFESRLAAWAQAYSLTMLLSATDANGNTIETSLLTNANWAQDPELSPS